MGKWGKRASWGAATALALGVASAASAADLGGNCCADLEERIAELEATTARKGNRKVSLEVSGWLNKTLLFWDDSIRRDVYAGIDNDAAQSRYRFVGSAAITPDVTAGFLYEFTAHLGLTSLVNQSNGGDDRGFSELRQANAWVESKRLGRITLGLASQATDGIAEIDLSRTEVVSASSVDSWIGGFNTNVNGVYAFFNMYEFFPGNFDGARDQLIRYDSPTIAGYRLSASVSGGTIYRTSVPGQLPPTGPESTEWDIALRYAGEWNGFRIASGVGYHEGNVTDNRQVGAFNPGNLFLGTKSIPFKTLVGSSSVLHVPSGLFFTTASGWLKFDQGLPVFGPDAGVGGAEMSYIYLKGGILANLLPVGQTSIYGEYYRMEKEVDSAADGIVLFPGVDSTSTMWGVGLVQHVDAAAMEIYAAYRFYETPTINIPGGLQTFDFGDFHMIQVGTRIRF